MAVRTAPIAIAYRDACNLLFPGRDRGADGFIGDAAHRAQGLGSQHNPRAIVGGTAIERLDYSNGIVLAVDVDNDYEVGNGVRSAMIAKATAEAARKCPYVSFVNWNWMVANGNGGAWRSGGADGPDHNHVSFRNDAINATYDWVAAITAELNPADLGGALTPTAPTVQEDDDMQLIQGPDRGIALVGPGYFRALTDNEEVALAAEMYGDPKFQDNRKYDVAKALALGGRPDDVQLSAIERQDAK